MTETAADEQDLAKALDSVASAASSYGSSDSTQSSTSSLTSGGMSLPPIVPLDSPVAPTSISPLSSATSDPSPVFGSPSDPQHSDSSAVGDDSRDTLNTDSSDRESTDTAVDHGPLASIKSEALNELRPLVDKLSVSPEEKFDTYLLLIRSTDDTNLIAPAHEAAKAIEDEARRAEALLDIIKEIDYLSRPKTTDN